jgi:hypothetical protein
VYFFHFHLHLHLVLDGRGAPTLQAKGIDGVDALVLDSGGAHAVARVLALVPFYRRVRRIDERERNEQRGTDGGAARDALRAMDENADVRLLPHAVCHVGVFVIKVAVTIRIEHPRVRKRLAHPAHDGAQSADELRKGRVVEGDV